MTSRENTLNNFAYATLSSPSEIDYERLAKWFRDNSIIAGLQSIDKKMYNIILPVQYSDQGALVGVVSNDKDLDFRLVDDQLALLLGREFSADVVVHDGFNYSADWSGVDTKLKVENKPLYIVGKMAPESSLQVAYSVRQSVEYAGVQRLAVWRLKESLRWHDLQLLPLELPAYIFDYDHIKVLHKMIAEPIIVTREGSMNMSYISADAFKPGTAAHKTFTEIMNHALLPGGSIDVLLSAGIIKKSQVKAAVKAQASKSHSVFIREFAKILDIPTEITNHIIDETMPEHTKIAKVSGWLKWAAGTVDTYAYEPDPNAGPLKKINAYIGARPLLDWTYMILESLIGLYLAYFFLFASDSESRVWWYYVLGGIGFALAVEGIVGLANRIRRSRKK